MEGERGRRDHEPCSHEECTTLAAANHRLLTDERWREIGGERKGGAEREGGHESAIDDGSTGNLYLFLHRSEQSQLWPQVSRVSPENSG